jgi:hypothetical protein
VCVRVFERRTSRMPLMNALIISSLCVRRGGCIFDFGWRAHLRSVSLGAPIKSDTLVCAYVCLIAEKLRLQERRVSRHQHQQQHHRSAGSTNGGGGEVRALTPDVPPAEKDPREVCNLFIPFFVALRHWSIYWKYLRTNIDSSCCVLAREQSAAGMQTRAASKCHRLQTVLGVS